ncbi:MAG: hypothetical protein AAGF83_04520 [Cyanobacteria bacterium P01_G01_bin.67]
MSKTIPSATIEELFPPNKNYQYFENFTKHPLKYKSEHFQMVNAWWLAESSLLAYAESDFAKEHFSAAGLTAELFSGKSTQCYVTHNDNFVIVAFRGTQVNDFRDIVRDVYINAKFNLVDSEQGGFVHQGFKEGLYTFDSPLVGDDAFSNDFSVNTYRFVNNNDFITLIPYRIPLPEISLFGISLPEIFRIRRYQHVGQLKYLDSNGHIIDNPNLWNRLVDSWKGQFGQLFHLSGQLREGWIKEIPVDNLTDHAPIYYAIHIWNNYKQDLTFN